MAKIQNAKPNCKACQVWRNFPRSGDFLCHLGIGENFCQKTYFWRFLKRKAFIVDPTNIKYYIFIGNHKKLVYAMFVMCIYLYNKDNLDNTPYGIIAPSSESRKRAWGITDSECSTSNTLGERGCSALQLT